MNEVAPIERDEETQTVAINPFGSVAPVATNAAAATDQARGVAQIQAAMLLARRFPRDQVVAMDKILNAFTRASLAEVAQYEYAKGGTDIRGPSIRAAEAIAQCWGNIHCAVEELEQRDGASTVRVFAIDAESGFQDEKVFQVKHLRHTRKGTYRLEDPREIYELIANQGARRKRACLLAVIPGDVVEQAMKQADVTLHTKAQVTPERLAALVEKFAGFGVGKEAIEARIQRRIDAMSPAQMVNLGKVYNSLKDGMSSPGDWFDVAPVVDTTGMSKTEQVTAALKAKAKAKLAPAPTAEEPPIDPPTAANLKEIADEVMARGTPKRAPKDDAAPTYAHVADQLNRAATLQALNEVRNSIRSVKDPAHRRDLNLIAAEREKALAKFDPPDVTEAGVMNDMEKASNRDTLDAAATLIDALPDAEARARCIARYHELLGGLAQ